MDAYLKKMKYAFCSNDIGLQFNKVTKHCYLPLLKFRLSKTAPKNPEKSLFWNFWEIVSMNQKSKWYTS